MPISAALGARLLPLLSGLDADQVGELVDLLVLIANADGVIDRAERLALQAGVETIMGSTLAPMMASTLVAESLENIMREGVARRAAAVGSALAKRDGAEAGLRVGIAVALASEGVHEGEHRVLTLLAQSAGVSPAHLDRLLAEERAALSAAD